jgi:hypothetical protein
VSRRTDVVHFFRSNPAELLGVLDDLARDRDGWVNLQAVENDEDGVPDAPPARAGMFNFLTSRGPRIPVSTWVPGAVGTKHPEPDSMGIQHGAGPKALRQLLAAGVTPPEGATMLSDHPRRGLVLTLPHGTAPAAVLSWIFAASDVLATDPLPDSWVAIVHHR